MAAAHLPGCSARHTRRQRCNGPAAEIQSAQPAHVQITIGAKPKEPFRGFFVRPWVDHPVAAAFLSASIGLSVALIPNPAVARFSLGVIIAAVMWFSLIIARRWRWRLYADVYVDPKRITFVRSYHPMTINQQDIRGVVASGKRDLSITFIDRSIFGRGRVATKKIMLRDETEADAMLEALRRDGWSRPRDPPPGVL